MAKPKYIRTTEHREKLRRAAFIRSGGLALETRFWARVKKSDGCWLWQGSKLVSGYGSLKVPPKSWRAHRLAWTLTYGDIPEGLNVCHKCDTPLCVNPSHLWLGTQAANNADRDAKGRSRPYCFAKLTESDVRQIRIGLEQGETQVVLARRYGVTSPQISYIKNRKTWKHVV